MKVKILYILFIPFLFITCKKKKPDKLEGDKTQLIGHWKWDSTYHKVGCQEGLEEYIYTPYSESENYSILFEDSGFVTMFNNSLKLSKHFIKFDYEKWNGGVWDFKIRLDNEENTLLLGTIDGNAMVLFRFPFTKSEDGCNHYSNYFVKS